MNSKKPIIDVIAVAFDRLNEIKVFVQSWINQTEKNWKLTIIHDGHNSDFMSLMESYHKIDPNRITFYCTEKRFNDYGHSLREIGLKNLEGDFVLITNADNYFIPKAVEFLNRAIVETKGEVDVVMFDMIHSHNRPGNRDLPPYSFFQVKYKRNSIDISSAIVKNNLAAKVGFRDKSLAGDATYFEDIFKSKYPEKLKCLKIPRVLFVHN